MFRRLVGALVDGAGRRPGIVLLISIAIIAGAVAYARAKLELRTDLLELLPRDSPAFQAYEHQLGRVGGGATFLVGIESPDRKANERLVDELSASLEEEAAKHAACVAKCADDACKRGCGPDYISYVEAGTKDVKSFFEKQKWLYAKLSDLVEADREIDHQIAFRSGLVPDLEADDEPPPPPKTPPPAPPQPSTNPTVQTPPPQPPPAKHDGKKPALGMDEYDRRWKDASKKHDDFPTQYFANEPGTLMVVRIISNASGTGGVTGDEFLADMKKRVGAMNIHERFHPEMKIGFAGDIPNAVAEKESILSEAVWATVIGFVLILGGIVFFYRSPWSLLVVAFPAFIGVAVAYAFATATFGYVNLPGAFLGVIILGNGINYPIVLLARYREFRARGMEKAEARREAVLNAFRAELVGACVGSIAYGSLTITQFRGFSQFGLIGFVGMLLVWLSIIPVVPALIVTIEWVQTKLPKFLRDPAPKMRPDGSSGAVVRLIARVTKRFPIPLVIIPLGLTAAAASQLPKYFADPWEYEFSKLDSRSSKTGGAGEWSNKVDAVFQGKQNISGTLILADTAEQVPLVKDRILANDKADPQGQLIDDVVTAYDFLPGTPKEQQDKLEVLESIRDRLTERVIYDLPEDEQKRVRAMRPPEDLRVLGVPDLPPLIRRRFEERDGRVGTLMYVKYKFGASFSDGHTVLRMAKSTDNIKLPDGTLVRTASRATTYAELIRSMERDGPLATFVSFFAVMVVVVIATRTKVGAFSVMLALLMGVTCLIGGAALMQTKLNFFNFIALPITFGIGCEYPFNVYDRTRILKGDVSAAVARTGGAVALCSYTTVIGYASLLVSDNGALQSFGRLAMFGEIACVAMALVFLPALLNLLLRKPRQ